MKFGNVCCDFFEFRADLEIEPFIRRNFIEIQNKTLIAITFLS